MPLLGISSPTQISGLNNWYDGSDPNGNGTLPANGASISEWKDKSFNLNHMVAQTDTVNDVAPVVGKYTTNNRNGLGTITFANSWYRTNSPNAPFIVDAYVVVKLNDVIEHVDVLSLGGNTDDPFNSLTFGENVITYSGVDMGRWMNGSNSWNRTYQSSLEKTAIAPNDESSTDFLLMSWSVSDTSFYIYRNGVQIMNTSAFNWDVPISPNSNQFRIGTRDHRGVSGGLMKGSIAEVLFYNRQLGTSDRQNVEGYLATKWNLRSSLPVTHPFYSIGNINALSLYLSGSLNNVSVTNPSYNVPAATSALSNPSVSLYATNIVASGVGFAVNSDERIKKNIQYLNSTDSFELVKALKPASFQYVDFLKGTIPKYGYLAQEVESVLPYTVNKNTGYIPNIFEMVIIEKNKIILKEKTTETLAIGTKLQLYNMENIPLFRQVVEIMDEKTFTVNESFSLERESIFLYGQEVEDYRSIDIDQMNTILLSALQETQIKIDNRQKRIDALRLNR